MKTYWRTAWFDEVVIASIDLVAICWAWDNAHAR
jgi:hypothetical protein